MSKINPLEQKPRFSSQDAKDLASHLFQEWIRKQPGGDIYIRDIELTLNREQAIRIHSAIMAAIDAETEDVERIINDTHDTTA